MYQRPIVVVDLPNFYSDIAYMYKDHPRLVKEYFLKWFDFNLFINSAATTRELFGIYVFYSSHQIGPESSKITYEEIEDNNEIQKRFSKMLGVSLRRVTVRSDHSDSKKCRREKEKECPDKVGKEKGVDSQIVTHLFHTMDHWDVAWLLSGDGDYTPAVAALREKGKIVNCVCFENTIDNSLLNECYNFVDAEGAIKEDYTAYNLFFREDCVLDRIISYAKDNNVTHIGLGFISDKALVEQIKIRMIRPESAHLRTDTHFSIQLTYKDLKAGKENLVKKLIAQVPEYYDFNILEEKSKSATLCLDIPFNPFVWQNIINHFSPKENIIKKHVEELIKDNIELRIF